MKQTKTTSGMAPQTWSLDLHTDRAPNDTVLIEALRRGDEAAFLALVDRYHAAMVGLARAYVGHADAAEDVAQEAWEGALHGLHRFQGRASLKTWLFRILTNCAKTCAVRERRCPSFSALPHAPYGTPPGDDAAVAPDSFLESGPWRGHWRAFPQPWDAVPEERLLGKETRGVIQDAIAALPRAQRAVITLRDVEGWPADEVCTALGCTEANQRVLLHRARSAVRRALQQYLADDETTAGVNAAAG